MSENSETRRKYPRIASHHSVLVKKVEGDLEEFARTRTMAVGGCSFVAEERIGEGSGLELLIAIGHRVVNARGRVVYERVLDDGRSEVGVEFSQLDTTDAELIQQIWEHPAVTE